MPRLTTLFIFLFYALSTFAQTKNNLTKFILAKAVKVVDGDTIDAITKDSTYRIRLHGIDAPERGQEYYAESKEMLEILVLNKPIYIEIKEKDRYGRSVAVIYRASDKLNINYAMVKKGMAWHFTKYSDDQNLAELQMIAREKELGLWSKYYYLEPWEYRKSKH